MAVAVSVRPGEPRDLLAVAAIQEASPEAAQWAAPEYLQYEFRVAEADGRVAGFLVARTLTPGEREILNMAVALELRRSGVARALLDSFQKESPGEIFLEVRESNAAARNLYKSMGFKEFGSRSHYYNAPGKPSETAIVMKFHSC